ncbi:FGGY-family carbohydrate kinase [Methyloterricola oryzae]|uniref:FGGY-family carbohydrate kinase n=1 Tax=Methyloterricola oryzae TaxID=1495050 RepID=UPI0005EB6D18|nr:FGGY-family carbohydrate kinase [Methyloterricola oryzae]
MAYVIGIDGGTESLRAGVFDLAGKPLAFAATPYPTDFPRPGWAEQKPTDWWDALGKSVRRAVAESGVAARDIAGLALDTTCCSVVALDQRGLPLRPALIWMDVRAAEEAGRVLATGDPALQVNGGGKGPVSAEWMMPKALWLSRHEPAVFQAAATICEYQDYLNFRLTGRMVASITNAAVRWHYQTRNGGYACRLAAALGIGELADKWPGEVVPLGDLIGTLTPEAAQHLGLRAGTPVAQGGADAFIAMLGLGVVKPGSLAFITGSSHLHLGLSARAFSGRGIWGTYADAVMPGLHVVEGGQTSTGSVVQWFKNLLGEATSYAALDAEAAALPPGAEGLLVQEHFQGNRTPHTDPLSRGAILGLSLKHGRGHIFRALLEGIAFGTEAVLQAMRGNGYVPAELVLCGGAARSALWMQIHADVSGLPLILTEVADAPALGCAILAAVGAGRYSGIEEAAGAMVKVARRIEPNPAAHATYAPLFAAYQRAYPALKLVIS